MFSPRRPLGRTGFLASVLGIGDVADRRLPIETCVATVKRAIDADDGVHTLLSNGTGPFAEAVASPRLTGPVVAAAVANVDADAHLDVLLASASGSVATLHGDGTGAFQVGATVQTVDPPGAIAVADVNGDGRADLIVATAVSGPNRIAVHLGTGAGGFGAATASPLAHEAEGIAVGDLNGDGKVDVVVTTWAGTSTHLGDGAGAFAARAIMAGGGPFVLRDFDGDGHADLAVSLRDYGEWYVGVSRGKGDGTFDTPVRYPAAYESEGIVAADVDADGDLDLLLAAPRGSSLTVLRNRGDGTFSPPGFHVAGPGARRLAVGDFDRDGRMDVVTLDGPGRLSALSLTRGIPDGFDGPRAFATRDDVPVLYPGWGARHTHLADMNGDGRLDVVALARNPTAPAWDIVVMLNDGTGGLSRRVFTDSQQRDWHLPPSLAVGDLDGDGRSDAVVTSDFGHEPRAAAFRGAGDGTFAPPVFSPVWSSKITAPLLDLDGDGKLDLVLGRQALRGLGDARFGNVFEVPREATYADVNGDGRPDAVRFEPAYSSLTASLNSGGGIYRIVHNTTNPGVLGVLAVADFSSDGKADILMSFEGGVRLRRGNGDGTFGDPSSFAMPKLTGASIARDFDGDGRLDLLNGTAVYFGEGDGTFRAAASFRSTGVTGFALGELDGDGVAELLAEYDGAGMVAVLPMYRSPSPATPTTLSLAIEPSNLEFGTPFTLTATIGSGSGVPASNFVRWKIDGVPSALTPVVDGASSWIADLPVGSHILSADYAGDEILGGSSASLQVEAARSKTTLALAETVAPTPLNATLWVSLAIHSASIRGPITGTVVLREGGVVIASIAASARLSTTLKFTTVGARRIEAEYSGDGNFLPSTMTFDLEITRPRPAIRVTVSKTAMTTSELVTLRAFIDLGPTGAIVFKTDKAVIGTAPIANGVATLTTALPWGFYNLQAEYSGDGAWAAAVVYGPVVEVYAGNWGAPLSIRATASAFGATIEWSRVYGGSLYTIWVKKSAFSQWESVLQAPGYAQAADAPLPAGTAWMFAVSARNESGIESARSSPDLATRVAFTRDPLVAGATVISRSDIEQTRAAANAVRAFAGLGAFAFSDESLEGKPVRAVHLTELRLAIAQALASIGRTLTVTDPTLTPGVTAVRAIHLEELRNAIR